MSDPVTAFVSAGSNIDPVTHLGAAVAALRQRYGAVRLSPVYRSAAVGFAGDDFLNLVLAFDTREPPEAVVEELERLHRVAGRERGPTAFRSRTLDLDLLLYGDLVAPAPPLKIPRDDIRKYAFVLRPLAELAPGLRHPVGGETMAELWAAFDAASQPLRLDPVTLA